VKFIVVSLLATVVQFNYDVEAGGLKYFIAFNAARWSRC